MERRRRRVKLSEHRKVTSVATKLSNSSPKVIRITVTDHYATDSSSDDDEDVMVTCQTQRVKRYVEEIRFGERVITARRGGNTVEKEDGDKPKKKYRGVRQRPWGKFAAEIRDPSSRSQIWIGTYDTVEEAAMVYDRAVIHLKGHNAETNFLTPPPKPVKTPVPVSLSGKKSRQSNRCPTSLLRLKANEEAECRTEPIKIAPEKKPVIVEEELQASLFPGLYPLAGWSLAEEYMWKSEIAPETLFVEPFLDTAIWKEGNLVEDFSFDLIDVFDSYQ